jgi:hypothetical protein
MKESKLLEMQNKVVALTNVMQQVINEISYLRELSVGTLETVKLLPGYEEAIEQLKSNVLEKKEEEDKEKKLEV